MSEHLRRRGAMDPYIRTRPRPGRGRPRRSTAGWPTVQHPSDWLPVGVICENCGRIGTTIATDWDGETCRYECRPDLVTWAVGCGCDGPGRAVRRPRQAGLEPRVGRPVEPLRGHDRALRQGPRHGRRLARSGRRDRPRGLRARAAAQRARTSSSTSAARRCPPRRASASPPTRSPRSCHPSSCASCSCATARSSAIEFDPDGTDAIPRLFDEFDRLADATAGREVRGELPAGHESIFRYSLARRRTPTSRRGRRASGRRSRTSRCCVQIPGVDVAARVAAEKGAPLTARRAGRPSMSASPSVRRWLEAFAPDGPGSRSGATPCPPRRQRLDAEQRGYLGASPGRRGDAPAHRRRLAGAHLRDRADAGPRARAAPSAPSTWPSSAGPTARGPAGCWPASSPPSSIARLREAASAAQAGGGEPA